MSGFMGMNTSDIRDTDRDQTFFWAIALPVTFVVLTTAFVYGYRGDAIDQFVDDMWESWRRLRARSHQRRPAYAMFTTAPRATVMREEEYARQRRKNMSSGRERGSADALGALDGGGGGASAGTAMTENVIEEEGEEPPRVSTATPRWLFQAVRMGSARLGGAKKRTTKGGLARRTTDDSFLAV